MAIEFSSFLGNINKSIQSIPFLNVVLSSVIYTSIILSILVIIVMLFIYPQEHTPGWILVKVFIYIVILNTIVFSAHHAIIKDIYKDTAETKKSEEFMTNINNHKIGGIYQADNIRVVPKFEDHEDRDIDLDSKSSVISAVQSSHQQPVTVSSLLDELEQR